MDGDNAYVGEHSPRITLDRQMHRGILQDGLGLRQGKDNTGGIVLRGSGSVKVVGVESGRG